MNVHVTDVSVWPWRRLRKTAAAWVRRGFWEVESLALFRALFFFFFKGQEIFSEEGWSRGLWERCAVRRAADARVLVGGFQPSGLPPGWPLSHLLPGVPTVPFVALSSHLPRKVGNCRLSTHNKASLV